MIFQFLDVYNAMTFEQSCIEMKNVIEETKLKYLQIFNLKTDLELNVFFALIEEEANTVCSKKMEGVGGWRCQDCAKSESTIFCQDCWSKMKDKHKDHDVIFNNQINGYVEDLRRKDVQINSLKDDLVLKEGEFNNQINIQRNNFHEKERIYESLEQSYIKQLSNIDNKNYCIDCFKEEISNNSEEINYLKQNIFIKKIFSPLAYLYLILKSNRNEISLNIKLYQSLKDSKCFNIGFYLNHNKDLIDSKWCKFFSPELHYVCNGFKENRRFNKKYFNRNSKKELLQYLSLCDK